MNSFFRILFKSIIFMAGCLLSVSLYARDKDNTEKVVTNWKPITTNHKNTDNDSPDSLEYILQKIELKGNHKTIDQVILRNIALTPGERFFAYDERLEKIRYKLMALGLFSSIDLSFKKGSAKGTVILVVTVVERNTIVVRDVSFGLTRISPNWDNVIPFGSIAIEDRSFLGSSVTVGGEIAGSKDQIAYRLYMSDDHFLNTNFGFHAEGIFAQAQEYFGEHYIHPPAPEAVSGAYEKARYRRAGLKIGTGYNICRNIFFWIDWRFENILAEQPQLVDAEDLPAIPESQTPDVGYLEPDASILSGFLLGVKRDTTNHPVLPFAGSRSQISIELSNAVFGSSYNFAKFIMNHNFFIPFGKTGQSISFGGTAGLITGNAPFFEQFFVGDFSSLAPDRKLGLNFSNLHPKILNTSIDEMWYEDLVLSVNTEYSFPFYRGSSTVYGVNGFIRFGVYSLTSTSKIDAPGVPIDITGDLGIRVDTAVGVFTLSFANILQLIPPVRKETTQ